MTESAPTSTCAPSASSTAPYITRTRGPSRTSPTTVAFGATYAVGSTVGALPRWRINMWSFNARPSRRDHRWANRSFRPGYRHPPARIRYGRYASASKVDVPRVSDVTLDGLPV